MALPKRRENGLGHIPRAGRIKKEKDGTISESVIGAIQNQLRLITEAINGGLRLTSGGALGRTGNLDGQMVEFTTPDIADTEIAIPHSLGQAPEGYIVVLQNKAGSVYTSNFGGWDNNTVYFMSDATEMLVNVILYK